MKKSKGFKNPFQSTMIDCGNPLIVTNDVILLCTHKIVGFDDLLCQFEQTKEVINLRLALRDFSAELDKAREEVRKAIPFHPVEFENQKHWDDHFQEYVKKCEEEYETRDCKPVVCEDAEKTKECK